MTVPAPGLDTLVDELLGSITILLEGLRENSVLILLYSSIDILSALDADDGKATRSTFTAWVDKYMTPETKLGCSSLEIYSARCGVVHTLSAETTLTERGKARDFAYVTWPVIFPEQNKGGGTVWLHLPTLWLAFRDGARQFQADVLGDQARSDRIQANLKKVYFVRSK